MNLKHVWILVIVALVGAGSMMLVRDQLRNGTAEARAQAVVLDQQLQDEAFRAYRSGRSEVAIPALDAYLQYLEGAEPLLSPWQPGQSPWLDGRGLASERMLTAGRLASVLERAGAEERAASLWARAVEYARASGRSDVSLAAVREAVKRSGPIAGPPDPDVH
jgi:hypothetical protein